MALTAFAFLCVLALVFAAFCGALVGSWLGAWSKPTVLETGLTIITPTETTVEPLPLKQKKRA